MSPRPQRVTLEWTLAGRTAFLLALCGLAATVPFGSPLMLFPATVLAAFAVSAPIAWLSVRRLQASTNERRSVRTAQRFEFPLQIASARGGPAPRDLLVFAGANGPASSRPLALFAGLGPGSASTAALASAVTACEWRTRRRGEVRKLALRVTSEFPLGMWRATAHLDVDVDWLSLPQIAALQFDPAQSAARRRERSLDVRSRRGDEEFYALRDARPSDSPHRIHWRSSARRGKTVVRELRGEEQPEAVLVLVGWVEQMPAANRQHEGFERAVSLAAAIVERRARVGESTVVRFEGAQPWSLRVSATRGAVQSLLAQLALVECSALEGGLASLRRVVQRPLGEGAFIVHAWPSAREFGRTLQSAGRSAAVLVAGAPRMRSGART